MTTALTYYESAQVCERLMKQGFSEAEIARRTEIALPLVRNRLALMASPPKLREMVNSKAISATLAIKLIKTDGENALEKAVELAGVTGKFKKSPITVK